MVYLIEHSVLCYVDCIGREVSCSVCYVVELSDTKRVNYSLASVCYFMSYTLPTVNVIEFRLDYYRLQHGVRRRSYGVS